MRLCCVWAPKRQRSWHVSIQITARVQTTRSVSEPSAKIRKTYFYFLNILLYFRLMGGHNAANYHSASCACGTGTPVQIENKHLTSPHTFIAWCAAESSGSTTIKQVGEHHGGAPQHRSWKPQQQMVFFMSVTWLWWPRGSLLVYLKSRQ